jgi:hypothetical protein
MSSAVKNKQILVVIFGVANVKEEAYSAIIKKCGFEEILAYEEILIR